MKKNFVKEKITDGIPVFGTWNTLGSPMVTEVMARAGFDFIIIDFEHGSFSISEVHNYVNASERYSCSPIVRVPGKFDWMIQQVLDQGAHGVILPGIETSQDVRDFVKTVKYKPDGMRGYTPFSKAGGFSNINAETYSQKANDRTLVGVIIESMTAFDNLGSILKVEGLDIVYFGAYDLSISLGSPGNIFSDKIVEMISIGVSKTIKAGKCAGGFVPQSIEKTKFVMDLGIKFVTYNVDSAILYNAIDNFLKLLPERTK